VRKHRGGVALALMEFRKVKGLHMNTNTIMTNMSTREPTITPVAIAMKNHHLALLCRTLINEIDCWHHDNDFVLVSPSCFSSLYETRYIY